MSNRIHAAEVCPSLPQDKLETGDDSSNTACKKNP